MPRVRFLKEHNGYAIGDEADVDPGVADAIVNWARAGIYVEPEPTPIAAALDAPPLDRMMREPQPKRKGGRPLGSKNRVLAK